MSRSRRNAALGATALLATVAIAVTTGSAGAMTFASKDAASPGSAGLGDRLFPALGNGGYDAQHYSLDVRYATKDPAQGIDGTVTLTAQATQALSRFNLDFSGTSVGGVRVDGREAHWSRDSGELVITPATPVARGREFTVVVSHFTAEPAVPAEGESGATAFITTPDGSVTAGQPHLMNAVFPSNDHPSDKATFSFRMDVPAGETAVANGDLTGRHTAAGRTVWSYAQREPMATELTQLVAGDFTVVPRGQVHGVTVRDVIPTRLVGRYQKLLALQNGQIAWMEKRLGAYPFGRYGSLIADVPLGFALETQTLSLYGNTLLAAPLGISAPTMLHELAHQWFGNSVTPASWSDVWLNEGPTTWYTFTYAAGQGYLEEASQGEATDFTSLMKRWYAEGDQLRATFGPVAQPRDGTVENVFSLQAYNGGALTLYALRQRIGQAAFDRLMREWVTRFQGRSASTTDFIALASAVSGQDQNAFLRSWLYGATTPPMPGHPDWTVTPPS